MGGDALELLPVLDPLQIEGDQPDAHPVVERQDVQAQQVQRSIEGKDPAISEVADIRGKPDQFVADAQLMGEARDRRVALEQVVVEDLDSGVVERDSCRLTAEPPLFPQRHVVTRLCEAKRRRQAGKASTDDSNTLAGL